LSLEIEAHVTPIDIRFKLLILKWYLKYCHSVQGNYISTRLDTARNLFDRWAWRSPFATEIMAAITEMEIGKINRANTAVVSPIPPTVNMQNVINQELPLTTNCLKTGLGIDGWFTNFLSEQYPDHTYIYTDGSKNDRDEVSSAMFIPSLKLATGWKLNPHHSVLGAELFAILQAVTFANTNTELCKKNVLILSDCRSALAIIENIDRPNYKYAAFNIQEQLVRGKIW
jgi:hypothetical protein